MPVQTFPRQFEVDREPPFNVGPRGSDHTTHGIRVQVAPRYMAEHSTPPGGLPVVGEEQDGTEGAGGPRWVWAYRVRITNVGEQVGTLIERHWVITDADGYANEVRGPGVVGHHPTLAPGQGFEYESFCPLETPWGTMEGSYRFRLGGGPEGPAIAGADRDDEWVVDIGRFYLTSDG